jgi:dihydrofolate synthase / folylpolyglutamate synthase
MTLEQAERYLLGLELFGMRFGLDRMRRLMTVLGSPQERYGTAAILRRHGLRAGAYLSPHLVSFTERIRIDDADVAPERFAAAVERARRAAEKVDRTLGEDDRVTQFEALTAAAYDELAAAGVQAAVVEAGLGGRYDATNVIASRV